jgi:hypothetical protein
VTTTATMWKVMRARQESVAINNIKNNSTLSAGSSWSIEHMKRPWIDPICLPSITTIVTMMRVVAKMIKSGLIVANEDLYLPPVVQDISNPGAALQIGFVLVKQISKINVHKSTKPKSRHYPLPQNHHIRIS